MPYRMVKKGYPWQGGQEKFQKEFFPLSSLQKSLGLTESGQVSDLEAKRFQGLEFEEELAQSATAGVDTRSEEARGEITREELDQHEKESRRRLGDLEGGYFL